MKRRDFLKTVVVVPLAVQLGLTRLVPISEVPAEELGGLCSCDIHGGPGCICDGINETSSESWVRRQLRIPEIDA